MKYLNFLWLSLCLFSCVDSIEPNEDVLLKEGAEKQFKLNGNDIDIQLISITDSRCPLDVQCVRAGEVIVKVDLTVNQVVYKGQELCLGCTDGLISAEIILGGNTADSLKTGIVLKDVSPIPISTGINTLDKTATFTFSVY